MVFKVILSDILEIKKIEDECFTDPWSLNMLKNEIKNSYFICIKENYIIKGYIIVKTVLDEAEILRIAVDKTARKKGFGKKLIDSAKEYLKGKNIKILMLEVRRNNIPAVSLYKKTGFYEVGVRKSYYRNPTDDALLMTLDFTIERQNNI